MKQPFYVGGIEDVEQSTGNAFGAAAIFFFIFVISMVHLIMDAMTTNPGSVATASRRSGGGGGNNRMMSEDSFEGWTGQRQGGFSDIATTPPPSTYQDDPDGQSERVGFLS
jgi:hypothetical protein